MNKMTPEQFAYWLQGYIEICGNTPSEEQWQIIKDHMKEVFTKVTQSYEPKLPTIGGTDTVKLPYIFPGEGINPNRKDFDDPFKKPYEVIC